MIKVCESNYEYKGYTITDNQFSGYWEIDGIKKDFPTSNDAEEYIDNIPNMPKPVKYVSDEEEKELMKSLKLPIRKVTYGRVKREFDYCDCDVYVLQYLENPNMYAGKNGLCYFCDDDMEIFKSTYDADYSRKNRKGIYGIEKYKLYKGELK